MTGSPSPDGLDRAAVRGRLAAVAAASLALAASWAYAPWSESGPVMCSLRLLTGLPCPGCGITRSFCAAAHGDLAASFGFHALGPAFFLLTAAAIPVLLAEVLRGRRFALVRGALASRRLAWVLGGVLAAYHAGRVAAGAAGGDLARSVEASVLGAVWRQVF